MTYKNVGMVRGTKKKYSRLVRLVRGGSYFYFQACQHTTEKTIAKVRKIWSYLGSLDAKRFSWGCYGDPKKCSTKVGKKWGGSLQILLPPDSQSIQNAQMVGSKKEIYWSCHEEQLPWPHLLGNVKSGE